jgi:hypothetical protein
MVRKFHPVFRHPLWRGRLARCRPGIRSLRSGQALPVRGGRNAPTTAGGTPAPHGQGAGISRLPAAEVSCPLFSITFPDRSSIFACRAGAGPPSFVDCSQSTKTGTRSPLRGERVSRGGAFVSRRGPGEGFLASFGDVARLGCLMTVKRLRTPSTRRAWRRGRGRFHRKLCQSVSS